MKVMTVDVIHVAKKIIMKNMITAMKMNLDYMAEKVIMKFTDSDEDKEKAIKMFGCCKSWPVRVELANSKKIYFLTEIDLSNHAFHVSETYPLKRNGLWIKEFNLIQDGLEDVANGDILVDSNNYNNYHVIQRIGTLLFLSEPDCKDIQGDALTIAESISRGYYLSNKIIFLSKKDIAEKFGILEKNIVIR